jgi:lysozyme
MPLRDWIFRRPQPSKPGVPVRSTTRTPTKAAAATAAAIALAIPFVAAFEGYFPRVYRDPVGVKTICYGQTAADGADFSKVYTKQECLDMLGKDLARYDAMVRKCIPQVQPPHREAALISFVYNLGQGNLCHSAVARNINAGNIVAGCNAMLAYNHAGGRVLSGLTRRRQAERALCLRSD